MIAADQIVAHAVGDYIIQSDWMANTKTKRHIPAILHALSYALPFLLFRPSLAAMAVIIGTHFLIDRYRLARFVNYAKNWPAPAEWRKRWEDCDATGYPSERPVWLAVWLLIITDNIIHVLINGLALAYL